MNFLKHSVCNGSMPRQLAGQTYFIRNSLLATMMRNRSAVRYLCAPYGFGKTMLACSYADLMYEFEHVFWLDGESPCFLRDLDAQTLLPDLLELSEMGDLIVFDDVPNLGSARRSYVWSLCSGLIKAGREVIVCATPAADPLRSNKEQCVCIESAQLLYSEKDWETLHDMGIFLRKDVPSLHPVGRVAMLAQCETERFRDFLASHILDLDDSVQRAISFVMLVVERGSFELLEHLLGREVSEYVIDAQGLRSFMQIDVFAGEFAALGFSLPDVLREFTPYLSAIAHEVGADDASDLALQLADVLLENGCCERAAQVVVKMCDPRRRSVWLTERQDRLFNACELVAAESVYDSLNSDRWRTQPALYTASRIRRAFIDHSDSAVEALAAVVGKAEYPLKERLRAASFAYLATEVAQRAKDLEASLGAQVKSFRHEAEQLEGEERAIWMFFRRDGLSEVDIDNLSELVVECGSATMALACCAHKARLEGIDITQLPHLCQALKRVMEGDASNVASIALVMARREIDALGIDLDMSLPSVLFTYQRCDAYEDSLEVQATSYARGKAARTGAAATILRARVARTSALRDGRNASVPLLHARLFGQFSISLGDAAVDTASFGRQKARTLLALLILECGHELSRDNLASRLWTDSTDYCARHNLNNCVSILRNKLSLVDGTCPYLVRSHGVVGLKKSLVESDIEAVEELCRRMRFADPNPNIHAYLLEQIRSYYRGEFMPSEQDEPMIVAAREEWRNRIASTFMHAARSLIEVGERDVSLQLAEQALACAPEREDCFEFLMAAQARSGQRPAAIDTWMRYRSFLSNELGLDPSPRAAALYERIINEVP